MAITTTDPKPILPDKLPSRTISTVSETYRHIEMSDAGIHGVIMDVEPSTPLEVSRKFFWQAPIESVVSWLPKSIGAITLWPFILYASTYDMMRLEEHEHFHWYQIRRSGVVLWYVAYLMLWPFYIKDIQKHPLESEAYSRDWRG